MGCFGHGLTLPVSKVTYPKFTGVLYHHPSLTRGSGNTPKIGICRERSPLHVPIRILLLSQHDESQVEWIKPGVQVEYFRNMESTRIA
jgi:hypothetical protein